MHPRTALRHAIAKVLEQSSPKLEGRIFPNRMEHWLTEELPAIGVYSLTETQLETDVSPYKEERSLAIAVEILSHAFENVDDVLDEIALLVESTLTLDALDIVLNKKIPLLLLKFEKTEKGIAVDGERQLGVATLFYTLEYRFPESLPNIADFLLAHSEWNVMPADEQIDMISEAHFQQKKE